MAQLVLAAAGSAIGGAIGGTFLGVTAASWGYLGGSLLAGALVKGPHTQGPRLGDLRVAGTEYGQPIPWVAGSPRIAGQVAWASARREIATTQRVGKGGGAKATSYTYEVDLLILLTENEIAGVSRIWSNGELVFNGATTKGGVWGGISVYTGAADQLPDPVYEAAVGLGNAPAYRGRGYVVITSLQLGSSGQIPNLTFEIGSRQELVFGADSLLASIPADGGAVFNNSPLSDHSETALAMINGLWDNNYTNSNARLITIDKVTGTVSTVLTWALDISGTSANAATGTADEAFYLAQGSGTGTSGPRGYLAGQTVGYVYQVATSVAGMNARFLKSGSNIYIGNRFVTSVSRFALSGGAPAATSPTLSHGIDHMVIAGGVLYAAAVSANKLFVFDATTLALQTEVPYPADTNPAQSTARLIAIQDQLYLCADKDNLLNLSHIFKLNPADNTWDDGGFLNDNISRDTYFAPMSDDLNVYYTTNGGGNSAVRQRVRKQAIDTLYLTNAVPKPLSVVASELFVRAGYTGTDIDVTALAPLSDVRGYAIGQLGTTRGALDVLRTAWHLEASKADQIRLRPRATAPVASVPYAHLGTSPEAEGDDEPLALTKANDLEVPAQVALSYHNVAGDYNVATEFSDRLLTDQESVNTVQLPLGLLPAEAKALADTLVIEGASSTVRGTLRVLLRYAKVEPGDVVDVTDATGRAHRLRVTKKTDSLTAIEWECVLDDVGALDTAAATDTGYTSTTTPATVAPTLWAALDAPLLRDADDSPGHYAAVTPDLAAADDQWPGAAYVQAFSADDYAQAFTSGERAVMGVCTTTLPGWTGGWVFDEASTLGVSVVGELSSATRDALLADETLNALMVGAEVLRFHTATLTGSANGRNQYTLRGFLRGQRGTEWAMASHVAAEACVLLGGPGLRRVAGTLSEIGLARSVKAVTLGGLLSDVTAQTFTDTGMALKPFAPANPRALASGTDLALTWQRRTRLQTRYGGVPGTVVPLGEAAESYRVKVYAGTALKRTLATGAPSATYTAAQLAADGFASGATVTFSVCQLSERVGEGHAATFTGVAP